jgi:putative oxidoreductase
MSNQLSITHGLLRLVTGFMFMQHGLQKVFGLLTDKAKPELMSQFGIGGLLELVGGTLVMIGLLTRPAAFVLSGMMAVAYFQFHQPRGWLPIQNDGELAVLYCFVFLYLAVTGSGPLSIEGRGGEGSDRR